MREAECRKKEEEAARDQEKEQELRKLAQDAKAALSAAKTEGAQLESAQVCLNLRG